MNEPEVEALYLTTNGDSTYYFDSPLEYYGYYFGLIEAHGKVRYPSSKSNFLCCDIIKESIVENIKLPILRYLHMKTNGLVNGSIHKVIWLPVVRPHISSIRLYISDEIGNIISDPKTELKCSLLFIPQFNYSKHKQKHGFSKN